MQYEIRYQPSYALAVVTLNAGERFRAEAGAMVSMSDSIQIETKTGGGLGSVLKRSVLGGETLFVNDMVATQDNSQVTFAPGAAGRHRRGRDPARAATCSCSPARTWPRRRRSSSTPSSAPAGRSSRARACSCSS